jgi:uncharacterized SAM-binding protein YcdF (DUF218 family)
MSRRRILWLAAVSVLVAAAAAHPIWLAAIGRFLVSAGDPVQADAVLVLAGDSYGHRVMKGGELIRRGYAPRAFVSGTPGYYDTHECDLAIAFAVRRGYPESCFVPIRHVSYSTLEEARNVLPELRRRGVRKLLIVTSDYHTRRAGAIFRALAPDLAISVVAARDEFFTPEGWWKSRQGQKAVYFELSKTIANWIGL